jgi:D-amino-acid dehydrogenase
MTKPKSIAVIGAGIVGMSAALYLQRDGHRVKVIDYRLPGTATSFGNAGMIVTGAITPTSTPGVLKQIPRYLFDRSSAVRLKWSYLPHLMPWLFRFVLESRLSRVRHAAGALHPLVTGAYEAHLELAALTGATNLLRPTGWLKLFRSQRGFEATLLQRQLMDLHAVKYEILGQHEIHQLEPHISKMFVRGLFHGHSASISLPKRLIDSYASSFIRSGGEFVHEQVLSIERLEDGRMRLRCDLGLREFDEVVVAAGAWSKRLCKALGDKVVLDTERGYHLNLERGEAGEIHRPLSFPEDGFILAPSEDGIRLTSGDELAGLDAPPDFSRINRMVVKAQEILPGLSDRVTREWMGRRPSTPDSLPVIGRSPNANRVIYAFGHHHLGLTLGPITGRIVADLVCNRPQRFDLTPYRINRFRLIGF